MAARHVFRLLPAGLCLALAASCGSDPAEVRNGAELADATLPAPPANVGGKTGASSSSSGHYRFVGRWAAEAALCSNSAWQFTADGLTTPAGSQCRFQSVSAVPGGYDIDAECMAEGPPVKDRLQIRFAGPAEALIFESAAIADAGLIYCGALSAQEGGLGF